MLRPTGWPIRRRGRKKGKTLVGRTLLSAAFAVDLSSRRFKPHQGSFPSDLSFSRRGHGVPGGMAPGMGNSLLGFPAGSCKNWNHKGHEGAQREAWRGVVGEFR